MEERCPGPMRGLAVEVTILTTTLITKYKSRCHIRCTGYLAKY